MRKQQLAFEELMKEYMAELIPLPLTEIPAEKEFIPGTSSNHILTVASLTKSSLSCCAGVSGDYPEEQGDGPRKAGGGLPKEDVETVIKVICDMDQLTAHGINDTYPDTYATIKYKGKIIQGALDCKLTATLLMTDVGYILTCVATSDIQPESDQLKPYKLDGSDEGSDCTKVFEEIYDKCKDKDGILTGGRLLTPLGWEASLFQLGNFNEDKAEITVLDIPNAADNNAR